MPQQVYGDYRPEHFEVWSFLYTRQLERLRGRVYAGYFDDLATVGFSASAVPRFSHLNRRLEAAIGWRLHVVEDFIPPREYLSLTSKKRLPATTFLRGLAELDHCRRADMFHDVFGHTGLLANAQYRAYLEALSEMALERIDDEQYVGHLANFNKWVSEFGLINQAGEVRAFGAGLLSSCGELDYALAPSTRRLDADVRAMVFTPHIRAEYQAQYFVIDSFSWLQPALAVLRAVLTEIRST